MASSSDTPPTGEVLFAARSDVTVEPHGEKFVIHDPRKNSFTQLGMAEYIVFRCFDGRSTTQDIADRLKRERDVVVTSAQVARLAERLHEKQMVLAPGEVVKSEDARLSDSSGIIARLVMIQLPLAWNPDVFLTRAYHRIKYVVFRPAFFVALVALVAIAFTVWIQSLGQIRMQAARLDVKSSFLLYYACFSATFFVHECAHGVACKGFGGKVPKIGSFLYFFVAVFYTDVSASWMFPSKFRRLMVLFAGALANLTLCAISTLAWRITIQGSPVNQVCFALMTINAFAASFTLFPLLRGDGYYILSTAVDIPNLRQNAQRYVGALVRRTFLDRTTRLPRATDREALIYLCYAPLQIAFVIGFFGYVVVRTGAWLIGELHFLGFWIVVLVLLDRIGRPVLRLVPAAMKLVADALRLGLRDGPRPLLALVTHPLRVAARWIARAWKLELLIAVPIALLAVIPYRLHVSAPFEVTSVGPVTVRAKAGGIVQRYLVTTGKWVKAGEVVAVLRDDEEVVQRRIAEARLAEARARLAAIEAGYRGEDRARAQADLRARQQATQLAAVELGRVRNLYLRAIASRKELDAATAAHQIALAREGEARTTLGMLASGYRAEERDRERGRVRVAEQELAAADQALAWTKIRAIADGRVVTPAYQLEQRVGAHVRPGDGVVDIVAPAELAAILAVPERFASDVAAGMPVTLRLFSDPERAYPAHLDAVEPAVAPSGNQPAGALG
ncbi:MAG TPA: HlyD family efflux transporter periplasmic adaptor subunit, partial [Kofleriaceae bacterium]|nr:HlyD family efflux transporter periplasmic adaptor subunit [Kofleriaceae bacterium]